MRLFLAVDIPDSQRDDLARLCRGVETARWTDPAQLHCTLRFLGELQEGRLPELKAALTTVRRPDFACRVRGVGCFPPVSAGRPARVLWAALEPRGELAALKQSLDQALEAFGPDEDRDFTPHITLARLKNAAPQAVAGWLQRHANLSLPEFSLRDFALYASELKPEGALHQVLGRFGAM